LNVNLRLSEMKALAIAFMLVPLSEAEIAAVLFDAKGW
jgi:hypothetical protein